MITLDPAQSIRVPAGSSTAPRAASAGALVGRLLGTAHEPVATFARLAVALLLFPHGAQHALGWFGGYGFQGTHGWMTKTLGFPSPAAALAIVVELLAPVALVLGLGGRLAALGVV